jgi:hypothetical protein
VQHVPLRASVNNCSSALRNFRLLGWPAPATTGLVTEGAGSVQTLLLNNEQDSSVGSAGTESPVELIRGQYQTRPDKSEPGDHDADRVLGQSDEVAAHVQSFVIPAAREGMLVDRVSLEVEDNHGDERFTCLYHPTLYGDA